MTSDERAQLIEDIRRSNVKRERIIEHASADESFDLAAAWETLDELRSLHQRATGEGTRRQLDCKLPHVGKRYQPVFYNSRRSSGALCDNLHVLRC